MKTKTSKKLFWLKFFSLFLTVAPLLSVFIYNFKDYFMQPKTNFMPQWLNISLGGVIVVIAIVGVALGKTDKVNGVTISLAVFLLTIFLQSMLKDIQIISFALFLGLSARAIFKQPIENAKQVKAYEKQAKIQATAISEVAEINGRG